MSEPVDGGRPLLRLTVLGFPVHLDISFVLIMGLIGYRPGMALRDLGLWLAITPVAVLVHELGHALTARATGARPRIALVGFGGLTTYTPPRPLSRLRALWIALAGPLAGLAVGVLLLVVYVLSRPRLDPAGAVATALEFGIWTCVGWSVLNLLPVLPLDGGAVMRELLPGDPRRRARRAAAVSVVTATLAALGTYLLLRQVFVAVFMMFFAVTNALVLRGGSSGAGAGARESATPEQTAVDLLWRGEALQARALLETMPPEARVDLVIHGAVMALTGEREQGHALLEQEVRRRPVDADAAALLVLTLTLEHDWDAVVAAVGGPLRPSIPRAVLDRAIHESQGVGREDVANRLTVLADAPT